MYRVSPKERSMTKMLKTFSLCRFLLDFHSYRNFDMFEKKLTKFCIFNWNAIFSQIWCPNLLCLWENLLCIKRFELTPKTFDANTSVTAVRTFGKKCQFLKYCSFWIIRGKNVLHVNFDRSVSKGFPVREFWKFHF